MDIAQLIGTYGFPIVACIYMAYYVRETQKSYRDDIKEMQTSHRNEINTLKDAVNNNTLVMTKLIEKLDMEGKI